MGAMKNLGPMILLLSENQPGFNHGKKSSSGDRSC